MNEYHQHYLMIFLLRIPALNTILKTYTKHAVSFFIFGFTFNTSVSPMELTFCSQ